MVRSTTANLSVRITRNFQRAYRSDLLTETETGFMDRKYYHQTFQVPKMEESESSPI